MPLSRPTKVGLGPGDIVLDGDPAPLKKGAQQTHYLTHVLWPNGWMDQDTTSQGGRPRPRPHCVKIFVRLKLCFVAYLFRSCLRTKQTTCLFHLKLVR